MPEPMIRRSMESARGTVLSPSVILFRLRPCLAQFPESAESWEHWGWWATENGFRMEKKMGAFRQDTVWSSDKGRKKACRKILKLRSL